MGPPLGRGVNARFVWRGLWEYPAQAGPASSDLVQKLKQRDAHSKVL